MNIILLELRSNLTTLHELHNCTRLVRAAGAEVQARCDSESARLQQQSVGYIVQLHAECNASLVQVRGACEQEVQHCSSKLAALNIEWNDSLIASIQTKCDDEKTELKNQLQTGEVRGYKES